MAHSLSKITLVHNPRYQRSGPRSYAALLRKYRFSPTLEGPSSVDDRVHHRGKHGEHQRHGGKPTVQKILQKKAASDDQVGDVPADDVQNDSEYLCPVAIGTPGQVFKLDFDTGSADLWIWSTKLPSKMTKDSKHAVFDPNESSTFKESKGSSWKITYGDNSSASGTVGTDTVNVGGLVIENQAIELAENLSTQFQEDTSDGLLGLAFGSNNTVKPKQVPTPVENMISQSDIPKTAELFTAKLGSVKDVNDPDKGASFYTFGYIDEVSLEGQTPYYTPVNKSQGFWMFNSASAVVAEKTVTRAGNTAIADTGTTLALVDDATCKAIYDGIPGSKYDSSQQGYVFPASTTAAQLPVVSFAVGERQFPVQKEDLAFADAGNGMTYGGIQSRGTLPFDILGDTFLKSIYAIFDQGNTRFGAVTVSDPTQNPSVPTSGST